MRRVKLWISKTWSHSEARECMPMSHFSACPFYLSTNAQPKADIIFLPYNYLIDSQSRGAQKIMAKNSIVIFDEGHNLEASCSDASSFELTARDLEGVVEELETVVTFLQKMDGVVELDAGLKVETFAAFKQMVEKLVWNIKRIELSKDSEKHVVKSGDFMYLLFEQVGINKENAAEMNCLLDFAIKILGTSNQLK